MATRAPLTYVWLEEEYMDHIYVEHDSGRVTEPDTICVSRAMFKMLMLFFGHLEPHVWTKIGPVRYELALELFDRGALPLALKFNHALIRPFRFMRGSEFLYVGAGTNLGTSRL